MRSLKFVVPAFALVLLTLAAGPAESADPNMLPNLDAFQANMNLQSELGLIKAGLDVKKYADLSIVQEAAKRLK